jgi:hypothetical protein
MRTRRGHGPWQKPGPSRLANERAGPAPADRVTVTRRIAAPVCAIFCLVCDPARHIDACSMPEHCSNRQFGGKPRHVAM